LTKDRGQSEPRQGEISTDLGGYVLKRRPGAVHHTVHRVAQASILAHSAGMQCRCAVISCTAERQHRAHTARLILDLFKGVPGPSWLRAVCNNLPSMVAQTRCNCMGIPPSNMLIFSRPFRPRVSRDAPCTKRTAGERLVPPHGRQLHPLSPSFLLSWL